LQLSKFFFGIVLSAGCNAQLLCCITVTYLEQVLTLGYTLRKVART